MESGIHRIWYRIGPECFPGTNRVVPGATRYEPRNRFRTHPVQDPVCTGIHTGRVRFLELYVPGRGSFSSKTILPPPPQPKPSQPPPPASSSSPGEFSTTRCSELGLPWSLSLLGGSSPKDFSSSPSCPPVSPLLPSLSLSL